MKRLIKNIICLIGITSVVLLSSTKNVYADEAADAQAILNAQLEQISKQQQEILKNQQQALLLQQQAILAMQQQAFIDQYQAALRAQAYLATIQANATSQAYLLNSIEAVQKAQYQYMLQKENLDYQDHLMKEYTESQKQALDAFKGYGGVIN